MRPSHIPDSFNQNTPARRGCFAIRAKVDPLFELLPHIIVIKFLFLDPVIDHIASLAVNF